MAITYYMLQIHPFLLFALIVAFGVVVAGLGTLLFRRFVRLKIQRSHNEVTGFLFLAIGSFYALLLSFVVLLVWEQSSETHSTVSIEGSAAMNLYRDIKYYPDTTDTKPLMVAYLDFVFNVIDEEFPNMERMETSRVTPASFDKVYERMVTLHPDTPLEVQLVSEMFDQLNNLSIARGQRLTTMESEISPPLWLPLIFGAVITLLCAMLLDIEHKRMHVGLISMLGAFIGVFFFTIIFLDHPFTGSYGIQPEMYKQIFTSEKWAAELYPKTTHKK